MLVKSAKAKGKLTERELERDLRQSGIDTGAYRTPGSGAGLNKGDIYSPRTGLVFEAKHTKNIGIASWRQAKREAVGSFVKPVLLWHPHNDSFANSLVVMRWADLKELLKLAYRS
jgi:hypothetical protein